MIVIDDVIVSDAVVDEQFVCDLNHCKGGCCVDGDAGAPLTDEELDLINHFVDLVKPYLTDEGRAVIEAQGHYVYDREFGWVTPTIAHKMCAYGYVDAQGIVKCGIEKAYNDGLISWRKPLSCHLFPIRTKASHDGKHEYVNYEPRQDLCKAACSLGKKLKVPVYVFLKDALTRKYGAAFYEVLDKIAKEYKR
ncbi:DUF3109 family protein [Dinghuibacter silviterrae]|uniref:Uncharacterized protein DUF3109 n=1 Tax=Dinghuibacter silviterrae TaxID=1539049 RepID=A0A4V3GLH0_9BACT|nr:DUF3109 family protein [Dinghuibacter silviterrae]TDW99502.1 uncharacterized protein DUF3109 [Dinghuibacter silviterrae]